MANQPGMVHLHLAWFNRAGGHWLAEWAGSVPAPAIDPRLVGDARLAAMNEWTHQVQREVLAGQHAGDGVWDRDSWDNCPPGGAVCLDVTRCGWPVGDHVWHRWDDVRQSLDWGPEHTFIEVDMTTLTVVANQRSHRPIRDAVPDQRVIDITGTPWAEFYGHIFGRFVWRPDQRRWGFEPSTACAPGPIRLALAEAPVGLEVPTVHEAREGVAV